MRKTKILYASSAMLEEDFSELFKDTKNMPGQQAQRFNRLLMKGLAKNGAAVCAVSAPPINKSNCSSIVKFVGSSQKDGVKYCYMPTVNIRKIKNATVMVCSFLKTFFSLVGRKGAVVCDVLNISVALGAVSAGRLLGKQCIGVVTDLPELMVTGHSEKQVRYCYKVMNKCTDFVLLTEAMNDRVNPNGKPYTIVEGICDEELEYTERLENSEAKGCFYAGLLDAEYGVKTMVDAFLKANVPNSTLHICGKGPYEDELTEVAKNNPQVVFHGVLLNSDVVKLEKEMSLLINPRPSDGEFTKYSFPSKVMEYMTSGTAVLATRLPGIGDEYYDYIYAFSGEGCDAMAESLKSVLSLSSKKLNQKGADAYRFVTEKKNSKAQAEKVLKLLKN